MPKRRKPTNWKIRVPEITRMMKTMTDSQIAEYYDVDARSIRCIRRYYGLLREGQMIYDIKIMPNPPKKEKSAFAKMDFAWQNLKE